MPRRVKVTLNCVADANNRGLPARTVEFSWTDPRTNTYQGGLIDFSPSSNSALRVDVHSLENVKVVINQADSFHMAMILTGMEAFVIRAIGDEGSVTVDRYSELKDLLRKGLIQPNKDWTEYSLSPAGSYLYRMGNH